MAGYSLFCVACGQTYADDGLRLRCDASHEPALLRTRYAQTRLTTDPQASGLARYAAWLPLRHALRPMPAYSVTFRSDGLARALGLRDLWIAFSGHWPERGAFAPTATFKDVEAAAITARFASEQRIMVTASAGNTAAALALACSDAHVPVRIVTPRRAYDRLPLTRELAPHVQFIVLDGEATYDDAIELARTLAHEAPFVFEGGVWNVARRDGIGTIFLRAVEAMSTMPDVYVQGIGSGAGAIAAFEAASRLLGDGRFGAKFPELLLVQNAPMSPVVDAWTRGSAQLLAASSSEQRTAAAGVAAPVLATSGPPYAVRGGLFDVLTATSGRTLAVDNAKAQSAMELFAESEGIDVEAAAGVALAGLQSDILTGTIDPDARVLLHVTGGGRLRLPGERRLAPTIAATLTASDLPATPDVLASLREKLLQHAQAA